MNYERLLRLFIKKLWLIILLPILTGVPAAYYALNFIKPVYEASTTLYVINKHVDSSRNQYSDNLVDFDMVKDYEELMKSNAIVSRVIDELNLSYDPEVLSRNLSVGSKNDTRIMEISVYDNDPKLAKDIANKFASVFILEAIRLIKVDNVEIVDLARVPKNPVNASKPLKVIALAVMAGFTTAVGVIFSLEYLNNKIRTPEDIEKKYGIPVLGYVPDLEI
ncbi:MAG TPA: Wzz/FepE/Etk N-terminal domain-containing protein [Pseudobacteroides sp.]|nr:Wzz/FepE/Etk N-terminal domain-containing protein [Pseudobacteroides sp.]